MIDYSDEYKYWDQTEPVTVTTLINVAGVRTPSTTSVSVAKRSSREQKEQNFNGISLEGNETFWLIPYDLMGSTVVRQDDVIKDANLTEYKVLAAKLVTKGVSRIHYRCATVEVRS